MKLSIRSVHVLLIVLALTLSGCTGNKIGNSITNTMNSIGQGTKNVFGKVTSFGKGTPYNELGLPTERGVIVDKGFDDATIAGGAGAATIIGLQGATLGMAAVAGGAAYGFMKFADNKQKVILNQFMKSRKYNDFTGKRYYQHIPIKIKGRQSHKTHWMALKKESKYENKVCRLYNIYGYTLQGDTTLKFKSTYCRKQDKVSYWEHENDFKPNEAVTMR